MARAAYASSASWLPLKVWRRSRKPTRTCPSIPRRLMCASTSTAISCRVLAMPATACTAPNKVAAQKEAVAMSVNPYPRDLLGYGRTPPEPRWPGEAYLALQFVINYEEGGENCILHGDSASEAFLSEIVGAQPWPGARHLNMESIYEYGSRAGFWRLHRLFTERNLPVTVYGVAMALERNPA